MPAQLLVMYNQPADPQAFESYYYGTHVPIFAKTPGVRGVVFSRSPVTALAGSPNIFLLAEVTFDSMADLEAGLASEAAQAAMADLPNFAAAGVTIVAFETSE
jgi:uncharacterized protein (TIGR02118 family)